MLRLIAILIFVPALSATVIVQKNGDVISGRILQERPDRYVFQSPYGKLQIAKSNVSKLILDEKQIQLQDVKYKDKTVQARLVAQDSKTSVYLTDEEERFVPKANRSLSHQTRNATSSCFPFRVGMGGQIFSK